MRAEGDLGDVTGDRFNLAATESDAGVSGANSMPIPGVGKPYSYPLSPNPSPPQAPDPDPLEIKSTSVTLPLLLPPHR